MSEESRIDDSDVIERVEKIAEKIATGKTERRQRMIKTEERLIRISKRGGVRTGTVHLGSHGNAVYYILLGKYRDGKYYLLGRVKNGREGGIRVKDAPFDVIILMETRWKVFLEELLDTVGSIPNIE